MGVLEKISEPLNLELEVIINGKKRRNRFFMPKAASFPDSFLDSVTRSRDLFFGAIALIQLIPVIIVVSLAVYITAGRPIFFCQKRLGKYGKLFVMYKFRTMRKDAEEVLRNDPELYRKYVANNYKLAVEEDPRITKLGCFLRRLTLDEVPQFLNVIIGNMSLVGPRPIVPAEIERYGEDAGEFLTVKPGITGLWQVIGRSTVSYPDRKYIDLAYVQNRSVYLDLKILLKTIKAVFVRRGAY